MTPEQLQAFQEWASKVVECMKKAFDSIKAAFMKFVKCLKSAFISACLESTEHKKKAQIYLRTKNRRIKRKQFKLLIQEVWE